MTTQQYLTALRKLGLTPHSQATAKLLDCSMRQIARFASGERDIPALVARVLELEIKQSTR